MKDLATAITADDGQIAVSHGPRVSHRWQISTANRCMVQHSHDWTPHTHAVAIQCFDPLACRGNYSATSNDVNLVHWPLNGRPLHLVQRGGDWAQPSQATFSAESNTRPNCSCGPPRPLLAVPNLTAHPSTASVPHCCIIVRCSVVLMCPCDHSSLWRIGQLDPSLPLNRST